MAPNDRVITTACSSAGTTTTWGTTDARGLSDRQVIASVDQPSSRSRSASVTASVVAPDREMTTTSSDPDDRESTTLGRRIRSDSGAADAGMPATSRMAAATICAT
jgi:hypothetical protein